MRILLLALAAAFLPFAPLAAQSGRGESRCEDSRGDQRITRTSSHSHETGAASERKVEILISTASHCVEARIDGTATFNADETDITRLSAGGFASFRERDRQRERYVRFTPESGDGVRVRMFEDGEEVPFDGEARRWLAELMPRLLLEAAYDAEGRVARLHAAGGTQAVLRKLATIESGGSRREHYVALLDLPALTPDEAGAVVRQATTALSTSSGDVRTLLMGVPIRLRGTPGVRAAVVHAVSRMQSDGDKRSVLNEYAMTADAGLLLELLGVVPSIRSDGDKRSVLVEAAENALRDGDDALRRAWFDAYASIGSDGDKRSVLMSAMPFARSSPALAADIVRGVGRIGSDGDASSVLVSFAGRGLLTTPDLRDLYASAARSIDSDGDRRRVTQAAERQQ